MIKLSQKQMDLNCYGLKQQAKFGIHLWLVKSYCNRGGTTKYSSQMLHFVYLHFRLFWVTFDRSWFFSRIPLFYLNVQWIAHCSVLMCYLTWISLINHIHIVHIIIRGNLHSFSELKWKTIMIWIWGIWTFRNTKNVFLLFYLKVFYNYVHVILQIS